MKVPEELMVGDVLFYKPSSLVGYAIAVKTWTFLSHVEGYCGGARVIAARPEGVNIYKERIDKYLVCVRRPMKQPFDLGAAWNSIHELMGPYETAGFLAFFSPLAKHKEATRICSSLITRWLRGGGCEPFNPAMQAADVSPAQLWQSPELNTVWTV